MATDPIIDVIRILSQIGRILAVLGIIRIFYVFCKYSKSRNVDCSINLPLFLCTVLNNSSIILVLFVDPEILESDNDKCELWDSKEEFGRVLRFNFVCSYAACIPCWIITIYIPYLALKRAEHLETITHIDILKCAGLISIYSITVSILSTIYHEREGPYKWMNKYCNLQPEFFVFMNILSFLVAFVLGPYLWFTGLSQYFKMVTNHDEALKFGDVMTMVYDVHRMENEIKMDIANDPNMSLNGEIVSLGIVSTPPEPSLPTFKQDLLHRHSPEREDGGEALLSITTASTAGNRLSLSSAIAHDIAHNEGSFDFGYGDPGRSGTIRSEATVRAIIHLGKTLDLDDIASLESADSFGITPDIIRVVNSLHSKLLRCWFFVFVLFVSQLVNSVMEIITGNSKYSGEITVLSWSWTSFMICVMVFEAPTLKSAGIRIIPYNENIKHFCCACCFQSSVRFEVE